MGDVSDILDGKGQDVLWIDGSATVYDAITTMVKGNVGSFDDKQKEPSKHFVADAVDAVLAGKTVETASTKAFGCGIQNKK